MFSDVKINEELSILKFGSIPEDSGSHKLCCVECLTCNKIIDREYRNRGRKHQCSVVDGNTKKCMRCGEWKDFTLFGKNLKLSGGVSKVCKKCYNSYECVVKYNKLKAKRLKSCFVDDFDLWINKRFSQLKARCKSRNIDIDITSEELKSVWTQQNGKCYYSGL